MAFDELPPDPYKLLGVSKDAKLPEIRSAHRKLVLKCHPDKVQDAALKAIKQDEFQKVQEAYELLSDDNRRLQYDEQVKLYALRKEMGRGNPTPRSNPFEYEVKTAEPRATTFTTYTRPAPKPMPRETTKVYPQQQRPNSYEDVTYESVRHPKKSASYESADRDRRPRTRDEDKARDSRRHEEDERARARWEKENKRAAHGEKKKRSDKEKKRGAEEKYSSRVAYVEEDDSDDYRAARSKEKEKEKARHRMEEEPRMRQEEARAQAVREAARKTEMFPLASKWDDHKEYAAQYMQATRRKAAPPLEEFHQRPMQRAETFGGPETKHNIRYAVPPQAPPVSYPPSDDDTPRRSSAPRISRRTSDTPPMSRGKDTPKSSSKEKEREKDKKKLARSRSKDPYIVEPPSPPLMQKPTLQTHNSAPPIIPGLPTRREPSRSKTQDYPRNKDTAVPPLPRAATFQSGDRAPDRGASRGSRLKKTVDYSSDSESDTPVYTSNRHSHSPPPSRRREAPEPTRYIIDNGRSIPITSRATYRAEMRNIDNETLYVPCDRERSESPQGTIRHPRTSERPPMPRAPGSGGARQAPAHSYSQVYYPPPPEAPEPVIRDARPGLSPRESSHGHSRGAARGTGGAPAPSGTFFGEVKFSPPYRPEDVIYNDAYRRGSDPTHHPHAARDYYAPPPPRGERVYAT